MASIKGFNLKQSAEREIKELYCNGIFARTAASATLDLTADIVLTSVAKGPARNTTTFTLQVVAPAANPTNTVLVAFTGTASAIVCTVTPNDGTNNSATPVTVTTANLVQLINTGLITGKTPTITDGSSLRALQTATGGSTTVLADAGEGDGVVATFASGDVSVTWTSKVGISSMVRSATGDFRLTLEDKYYNLKSVKGIVLKSTGEDIRFQIKANSVLASNVIDLFTLTGSSATDPSEDLPFYLKLEVKNSTLSY